MSRVLRVFETEAKIGVSPGTSTKRRPRVREAQFGDGYTQRMPDGINHIDREVSLNLTNLTAVERNRVNLFLFEHGGYLAFLWTFPGDATAQKWICQEWDDTLEDHNVYSLSMTFKRVYDR